MATKIWLGDNSGNEGNWSTAANWSPFGVPGNGDDVLFVEGAQDVTAGLNQSTVALDSLSIGQGYTGSIGTSSGALQIGATDVRVRGGEEVWLDGTYARVIVSGGSALSDAMVLDGDIASLLVLAGTDGTVRVTDSATINNVRVIGVSIARVNLGASLSGLALVEVDSGIVTCGSAATTLRVLGPGTLTHTSGAVTTALVSGGGSINYNSSGTLTNAEVYNGVLSFVDNISASVTVTNTTLFHPGSEVLESSALSNVIYTNDPVIYGGVIRVDPGRDVGVS